MSEDPTEYITGPSTAGWRCSCGATPDPAAADWRWTGSAWEHHHGGQAGHFRAEYTPPEPGSQLWPLPEAPYLPWPQDDCDKSPAQHWPGTSITLSRGGHVFVGKGEITGDIMLEFVTITKAHRKVRLAFGVRPCAARALHQLLGEILGQSKQEDEA